VDTHQAFSIISFKAQKCWEIPIKHLKDVFLGIKKGWWIPKKPFKECIYRHLKRLVDTHQAF
jgi:hypothetical protein